MKFRKLICLWAVVIVCVSMLAACGAPNSADNGGYAGNTGSENTELSKPEEGTPSNLPEAQKLIRTVWLDAETENLDALLASIEARIAELDGYVEARKVYNGSSKSSARYRYAELTVRIPAEKLDKFVNHVTDVSNITSSNETTENVTLSYVAIQSRITALQTEEARLLELLATAEDLNAVLQVEKRLTEVRTELEEVTSQLRLYDNLVNYGTIHLSLREVKEYTVTEEPETLWERISEGFNNSLKDLGTGFTELFVFLIVGLPYLAVMAVIVLVIVSLVRRKRKKKQKAEKE